MWGVRPAGKRGSPPSGEPFSSSDEVTVDLLGGSGSWGGGCSPSEGCWAWQRIPAAAHLSGSVSPPAWACVFRVATMFWAKRIYQPRWGIHQAKPLSAGMLQNQRRREQPPHAPRPTPLAPGQRLWQMPCLGAHCLGSNLALFSGRTSTGRRSYCWHFPPCRSAWSWSWDPPSSCAIRSRELKWLSTPSMPTDSTFRGCGPLCWWCRVLGRFSGLELLFFWVMRDGSYTVTEKQEAWRTSFTFIHQPVS